MVWVERLKSRTCTSQAPAVGPFGSVSPMLGGETQSLRRLATVPVSDVCMTPPELTDLAKWEDAGGIGLLRRPHFAPPA